jgi:hydrogenase nickel incorporation protein HypA/HybF
VHEYSLVRSLLARVAELARAHPGARICQIDLCVGEFAGVEMELIRLAFDDLVAGSELASTRLHLRMNPLEGRCNQCGDEFPIEQFRFVCPICSGSSIQIVRGEELLLERVALEWSDQACSPIGKE